MTDIFYITGNKGKAEEVQRFSGVDLKIKDIDLPEIQSLNQIEVVKAKVEAAYEELQTPVLVEDTSLVFKSLNQLPGTFIKWFLGSIGNEGLCSLLSNHEDRSAVATMIYAFHNGEEINYFEGKLEGRIANEPKGESGFGWNPIFIPSGFDRTLAQLSNEEFEGIAPRKKALEKFKRFIEEGA